MNQKIFDNNQFIISYELLELFKWLLEYDQEGIRKLIERALSLGFDKKLKATTLTENSQDLQKNILDFFLLMETLLYESINEEEVRKIIQHNLIPEINQIDSTNCDNNTLAMSIAKATNAMENHPNKNPKDVLCKELLRRWKPKKLASN